MQSSTIKTRTFIAHVEDRPGVLNRIASLFRRRGFNIISLTVGRTHDPGVSKLTVVVDADDDTARRIEANLYKLVNVLQVQDLSNAPAVARELALIKVRAHAKARSEVLELCKVFRARVVDVSRTAVVVEITGTHEKVDGLIDVLRPYHIVEMVRTGVVAMTRGAEAVNQTVNPSIGPSIGPAIGQSQIGQGPPGPGSIESSTIRSNPAGEPGEETADAAQEADPWHESSTTATPISA